MEVDIAGGGSCLETIFFLEKKAQTTILWRPEQAQVKKFIYLQIWFQGGFKTGPPQIMRAFYENFAIFENMKN